MEPPPLFSYDLAAQQIIKAIHMLYAFSCCAASHWIYFRDNSPSHRTDDIDRPHPHEEVSFL